MGGEGGFRAPVPNRTLDRSRWSAERDRSLRTGQRKWERGYEVRTPHKHEDEDEDEE